MLKAAIFATCLTEWAAVRSVCPLPLGKGQFTGATIVEPFTICRCICRASAGSALRDWEQRVLHNSRLVMIHLWSKVYFPTRSAALAPVIDEVVLDFDGQIDAVRRPGPLALHCADAAEDFCHYTTPACLTSSVTTSSLGVMVFAQYSLAYETSPNAEQFSSTYLPAVIFFKVCNMTVCDGQHDSPEPNALRCTCGSRLIILKVLQDGEVVDKVISNVAPGKGMEEAYVEISAAAARLLNNLCANAE